MNDASRLCDIGGRQTFFISLQNSTLTKGVFVLLRLKSVSLVEGVMIIMEATRKIKYETGVLAAVSDWDLNV